MNFCRPARVLRLFPARCRICSHIIEFALPSKIYVKSNLLKSGSSCTVLFVHLCQLYDDDEEEEEDVPCSPALCMLSVPVYQPGRTSCSFCTPSFITSL